MKCRSMKLSHSGCLKNESKRITAHGVILSAATLFIYSTYNFDNDGQLRVNCSLMVPGHGVC